MIALLDRSLPGVGPLGNIWKISSSSDRLWTILAAPN